MVIQQARLDIHEQQIQQLQSDVTEIKASLSTLIADREDSREFRSVVLAWMKSQEKMHVDGSSSSGHSVLDFTSSSIRSDSPAILRSPGSGGNIGEVFPYSRLKSVSNRDFGPKYASDGDLSGGLPSVIAQLEALVSRSENRLRGYGYLMSTGHTDSCSSSYEFQLPTPAPLKAIISRSEEHGCLMSHSDNGVMTDDLQGKLGSGIVVGHGEEKDIIVGWDSSDLGPFCEKNLPTIFGSTAGKSLQEGKTRSRDAVLITVPPIVFPSLASGLQWNSISLEGVPTQSAGLPGTHWWYKIAGHVLELTFGQYHLWIVHGQGRPPENAIGEASTWLSSQFFIPSLEGKTVLKGGVMIGIVF